MSQSKETEHQLTFAQRDNHAPDIKNYNNAVVAMPNELHPENNRKLIQLHAFIATYNLSLVTELCDNQKLTSQSQETRKCLFSLKNAILSSLLYIECFRNQPVPVLINSTELSKHSYHTEDILHVSCDTLCRDNRQLTSFGFDDDSMYNTFLKRHLNKI